MEKELLSNFLKQEVTLGVEIGKERPYLFTGELLSINDETCVLKYKGTYKSFNLEKIVEIQPLE